MSDFDCCETRPALPRNQQVDAYDRARWGATLSDADLDVMRARCIEREIARDQAAHPTAAELLALQETLSRAYLARNRAVNAYVSWPVDALADELDELMSDIAFERYSWLAPIP